MLLQWFVVLLGNEDLAPQTVVVVVACIPLYVFRSVYRHCSPFHEVVQSWVHQGLRSQHQLLNLLEAHMAGVRMVIIGKSVEFLLALEVGVGIGSLRGLVLVIAEEPDYLVLVIVDYDVATLIWLF